MHEHGLDKIRALVDQQFARIHPSFSGVDQALLAGLEAAFALPPLRALSHAAYDRAY